MSNEHEHKHSMDKVAGECLKATPVVMGPKAPCLLEIMGRMLFEPDNVSQQDRQILCGSVIALGGLLVRHEPAPSSLVQDLLKAAEAAGVEMRVVTFGGPEIIH